MKILLTILTVYVSFVHQAQDKSLDEALTSIESRNPVNSLILSESLANSSIKISGRENAELKGLLALEAFKHNKKGYAYDNEVINALYYALKAIESPLVKSFNTFKNAGRIDVLGKSGSNIKYLVHENGKVVEINLVKGSLKELMPSEAGLTIKSTSFNPLNDQLVLVGYKNGKGMITTFNTNNPVGYNKEKKLNGIIGVNTNRKGEIYLLSDRGRLISRYSGEAVEEILSVEDRLSSFLVTDSHIYGGTWGGKFIKWNLDGSNSNIIFETTSPINFIDALSPDYSKIAFGDASCVFYTIDEENKPVIYYGHKATITSVDFTGDQSFFVTGSLDNTIKIWNGINNIYSPVTIADFNGRVTAVSFSKDGNFILVTTDDKTIIELPMDTKIMTNDLCNRITRDLTKEEWNRFLQLPVYQSACSDIN